MTIFVVSSIPVDAAASATDGGTDGYKVGVRTPPDLQPHQLDVGPVSAEMTPLKQLAEEPVPDGSL